jgi:hypothetical protein
MPGPLSGPGVGLPLPQNLYPSELLNTAYDFSTNRICLAPGNELPIPAGVWFVDGMYSVLEFLDAVNGLWELGAAPGWGGFNSYVKSDGFNVRLANRTGCLVGAVVLAYGSGYVQASTSISVVGTNATMAPIVGGQLIVSSMVSNGGGYGVAPIVYIPAPPGPTSNSNGVGGIQATAFATIAGGTVSTVSLINPGAGYQTAPAPIILTNPTDPNINSGITQATVSVSLTGSGSITGALLTNPGAPLATIANITLTVAGAGTGATISPVILQSVQSASVTGAVIGGAVGGMTAGGAWPQGSITNSAEFLFKKFRPRPANITFTPASGTVTTGSTGNIVDGGLFASTPSGVFAWAAGASVSGGATLNLVMGGVTDYVILQSAP